MAPNDDFVKGMKKLFNYSLSDVENIMKQLPADRLIALVNAVRNNKRIDALTILDRKNVTEDVSHIKGSFVNVDGKEGVVTLPTGPYDTVGVNINGKELMYNKQKVKKSDKKVSLEENIIGFNPDPILRLQELSGISQPPQVSASSVEKPFDPDFDNSQTPAQCCMDAIATLKACLPQITVKELSSIRKEIYNLTSMLNESVRRI